MQYDFPVIKHIDEVLPAIEGRDEFIVAKKAHGWPSLSRKKRGAIYGKPRQHA